MDSFLYPEVPRVNVLRSLSCSQSIRQRSRRRTFTLYFDLHRNSQILVHRSQGRSNLTSFHHCVKLRFSDAQCCQALSSWSRFHIVATSLSHQSRRVLPRDWVASKVAVHEDCNLVNMFLSSKSRRCIGLSHLRSRCTFQRDEVNSRSSLILWATCFAVSAKANLSWARYESLTQADLYRVASSFFRIGLRVPSDTSLSCSFSRGVLTVFVFVLHPDSTMMSGACLKSGSMSKCCPV